MGLALWHDSDLCYMRKVFNIETLGPGVGAANKLSAC